jgi:hypothetical protein
LGSKGEYRNELEDFLGDGTLEGEEGESGETTEEEDGESEEGSEEGAEDREVLGDEDVVVEEDEEEEEDSSSGEGKTPAFDILEDEEPI